MKKVKSKKAATLKTIKSKPYDSAIQADKKAIRALVVKWMNASKAGDLATVLTLMSDDVVFMVPGQEPFGKEKFAAQSKGMKDVQIEGVSTIKEINVIGNWAWIRNHIKLTITPPGMKPMIRTGYTLTILRKKTDGNWVIARDANLLTVQK